MAHLHAVYKGGNTLTDKREPPNLAPVAPWKPPERAVN